MVDDWFVPENQRTSVLYCRWSDFLSHERIWPKNEKSQKLSNLQQINYRPIKWTKTPILPNCQVPNGYFFINLHLVYSCSSFDFSCFCASFSHFRKSERIERKIKTQNTILRLFGGCSKEGPSYWWTNTEKCPIMMQVR